MKDGMIAVQIRSSSIRRAILVGTIALAAQRCASIATLIVRGGTTPVTDTSLDTRTVKGL